MIPTYNNFVPEQLLLRAEEFSLHIYHFTYIYIYIYSHITFEEVLLRVKFCSLRT